MSRWIKTWYQFLRHEFNATAFRREKTDKVRKYEHIEIQKEFHKLDHVRRQQRHALLVERKKLLENHIAKTKLIQARTEQEKETEEKSISELESVASQLQSIEDILNQEKKDIMEIDKKLQDTESEVIMVTGYKKMAVQNHITYLQYMRTNNTGFTLHKETQNAIENIHYLLDHNLPLSKFKLFEVFPELFVEEIGELEQSVQRLLEERREELKTDSVPMYRPFGLERKHDPSMVIENLAKEESNLVNSITKRSLKMLEEHTHLLDKIERGETRFRSIKHFIYECRDVEEREEFTEEQWKAKQVVLQIYKFREEFQEWKDASFVKIHDYHYKTRWPAYLSDKPDLVELYKVQWEVYRSKLKPLDEFLVGADVEPNYLQIKIRHYLQQQTKRRKNQAIDGKMDRSVNSTQVYKLFTKCLAEVQQQQLLSTEQKQQIYKFPKTPKNKDLPENPLEGKVTANEISKMIMLNHKDSLKFNLQFFSQYFGVEERLMKSVLDGISIILRKEGGLKVLKFV